MLKWTPIESLRRRLSEVRRRFFHNGHFSEKKSNDTNEQKIGVVVAVVDLNFQTDPKFDATAKELFSMEIKMS